MLRYIVSQLVTQSVAQNAAPAVQNIDAAQNLNQALRVMGLGMLGIFCIIGIIVLLTWTLQKLFPVKAENDGK